jgi:hypothetical protein
MSIIRSSLLLGAGDAAGGFQVSRSLRFNSGDSAYLNRTPASAGNRQAWTWSAWVKRSTPDTGVRQVLFAAHGAGNDSSYFEFGFDNSANLGKLFWSQWTVDAQSAAVFRDFSAWYHILISYNGSNIVAYVNGTAVLTSAKTGDLAINGAFEHGIGRQPNSGRYFSGYLANIHFIDGQALTPASFAETDATTGQWIPKAFSGGSYGTNGFYLKFDDNSSNTASTLGKDYSGLGNNWTPNNLSVTAGAGNDSLVDSPTNYGTDTGVGGEVRGNYATLNPLQKGTDLTLSNGNLDLAKSSTVDNCTASTIGMTSGKWYFELTITNLGSGEYAIGFGKNIPIQSYMGSNATTWSYADTGRLMNNGSTTSYGSSYTTGDILGAAFDGDNGTLTFYKNGTSQGTAVTGLTQGPYFFTAGAYSSAATRSANFGQRAFAYTAPSGFKALCTQNLPEGTITTSGTFTGNASADGPFVYLNGVPTAMTINSNAVTFATHADKLSNGFKLRTSSGSYNTAGSNTYSITTTGDKFKYARAQPNP